MMKLIRLLLVEDDSAFAFIVKGSLELTGKYDVLTVSDGKEGLNAYQQFKPDIIVSDIEMPEMNGLEMVKKIRQTDDKTPILFASARTSPKDLIDGYEIGANNYIRKPFLPEELNAHVQGAFRQLATFPETIKEAPKKEALVLGNYQFNVNDRLLQFKDQSFHLTHRETQILWKLYQHNGEVVRRKDMLEQFWDKDDFYASRSLDVFVNKLRKYLEQDPNVQIHTLRGEGLQLSK